MISDPTLLVVDDEQVYCDGCERIFSRQGFRVEGSNDATEALDLATSKDYSAIILDVKMPNMDGIRFLEHLRAAKPNTPVILMTGYPSIQNAASAVRLGASDYVTKPFTPEQITLAVRGILHTEEPVGPEVEKAQESRDSASGVESESPVFHGRAWARLGDGSAVRVGGIVPRPASPQVELQLPRVGDIVHQGLPLLAVRVDERDGATVPAPVTGMVLEVNAALQDNPDLLWDHPTGLGWIARIAPTRLEPEEPTCKTREITAVSTNQDFLEFYRDKLSGLGCVVHGADPGNTDSLLALAGTTGTVFLDAASAGANGPSVVESILEELPETRIVVVAPDGSPHESAYRTRRVFYYTVQPLEDAEILDIVDSLYCPPTTRQTVPRSPSCLESSISALHVDTDAGCRVSLLVPGGLLQREVGLGLELRRKLLERLLPLETGLGDVEMTPARVLTSARKDDRAIVLTTADMSRIPGSLVPYRHGNLAPILGVEAENVTVLAIQPTSGEAGMPKLDARALDSLAEHIVGEMLA